MTLIIQLFTKNKYQRSATFDRQETLEKRYVKGEIFRNEYLEICQSLK
ncbi:MAG: hypothetical protein R6U08_00315 [Bacillota bacterium]